MDEAITGFVGLDAHAESTAIGFAQAGRATPRSSPPRAPVAVPNVLVDRPFMTICCQGFGE